MSADVVLLPVSWLQLANQGEGDWQEQALCAQADPEAWFPEKGGSTKPAKRICSGCAVRAECLEHALVNDDRFGIWGGLSERERRALRTQKHRIHNQLPGDEVDHIRRLIAAGLPNRTIADRTGRSMVTVQRIRHDREAYADKVKGVA